MIAYSTLTATISRRQRLLAVFVFSLGLMVILLTGLTGAQASSVASTRYVATTGNDGGGTSPCTSSSSPCRTVQQAVNVAANGGEIRVATGIYTGVQSHIGITQVVYMNKTIALHGGYTTTNWTTPYPITQPTALDAGRQGRVVYITGDFTILTCRLYLTVNAYFTSGVCLPSAEVARM
ncbi:MAG TPA: hypothetical protein VMP08_04195 [Anaerolineae bacterium]|nr:hypothetical protein [Anaerolineae bacterium]